MGDLFGAGAPPEVTQGQTGFNINTNLATVCGLALFDLNGKALQQRRRQGLVCGIVALPAVFYKSS
jgi:hypothetical protein